MERKEAIEIVRKLYNESLFLKKDKEAMVTLIPELKENEDKKTKSDIQYAVRCAYGDNSEQTNKIFAWLEKQEQKPAVTDFNAKDWYVSKVDGKIHDMTYNPADKVEPKFHKGDWVVRNDGKDCFSDGSYVVQITDIIGISRNRYKLSNGCFLLEPFSDTYRLWTISDAKDGDVLAVENRPFIYSGKVNPLSVGGYCGITNTGLFKIHEERLGYGTKGWAMFDADIHPATKEQRDTLMKAMAEAGWEFDFEKKELKKISQEHPLTTDE